MFMLDFCFVNILYVNISVKIVPMASAQKFHIKKVHFCLKD